MPGQHGLRLWQQAVRTRPELRSRFLLLGSAPLPDTRTREYFTQSERLLAKPFIFDALCYEVDAIVRRRDTPSRTRPPATLPHPPGGVPPHRAARSEPRPPPTH